MKSFNLTMKSFILLITIVIFANSEVFSQWQQTYGLPNAPIYCIASSGENLYAGITFSTQNSIFLSTNSGLNWNGIGLPNRTVNSIALLNEKVVAGTDSGVFLTTNNGLNWSAINYGLAFKNVKAITFLGTDLYAGSIGIWKTTNFGILWYQTSLINHNMTTFYTADNTIFAGTSNDGIFNSTNNGVSWNYMNLNSKLINTITTLGSNIFAGTTLYGNYRTTNYGSNWEQVNNGISILNSYALVINQSTLFNGYSGVYVSTNNGDNWYSKNEGMGSPLPINCLLISNGYIYAGTTYLGIWRRQLSEFIGIKKISSEIPEKFSISQNYPNPFNPVTTIIFRVKKSSFVSIDIFDISGRKIENLMNENLIPGTYEVKWVAKSVSSGIYYYKIITPEYTKTLKMILLK